MRVCDACESSWLGAEEMCPNCGAPTEVSEDRPDGNPERYVPFAIGRDQAADRIGQFVADVRFPTEELDPGTLAARLTATWWPFWLVDTEARATWEAEVGFDYDVKSSVEQYGGGGWTRHEVTETRVRWEPRAGTVARAYPNVAVPGLADQPRRSRLLGEPRTSSSQPWDPAQAEGIPIQLPDRAPSEQWPAAVAVLRNRVGQDCARASAAQHFRELRLNLDAEQAQWSWLLVPGWTTWYVDDDGERRILWVDGVSGRTAGPRMASVGQGQKMAWALAISAMGLGCLAAFVGLIGVVLWPLLVLAALMFFVAIGLGIAAVPAALGPDRHNREELERTA